jgi:hypothetical protein
MPELNISYAGLIIIFSNVLSFMIIEALFFWYIIGRNFETIIDEKASAFKQIYKEIDGINTTVDKFINSVNITELEISAREFRDIRHTHNINEFSRWLTGPIVTISILLILCILAEFRYKKKFDITDFKILIFIFFSFTTEIIFYFVVIYNSDILSDIEFIEIMATNMKL